MECYRGLLHDANSGNLRISSYYVWKQLLTKDLCVCAALIFVLFCLQEHAQQTREHEAALAGASQLQQQLADLQQQLAETVSSFNSEQESLREAVQQAEAARAVAEAAAADAQQQLALARAVLAERLGQAERELKQQQADLQVGAQAAACDCSDRQESSCRQRQQQSLQLPHW
jgi:hypothetical protein